MGKPTGEPPNHYAARGVRLARHAYRSRMKQEPPPIVEAHFELDGTMLQAYAAAELEECQ